MHARGEHTEAEPQKKKKKTFWQTITLLECKNRINIQQKTQRVLLFLLLLVTVGFFYGGGTEN